MRTWLSDAGTAAIAATLLLVPACATAEIGPPAPKRQGSEPPVGYSKIVKNGVPLHVVQIDPRNPDLNLAVVTPMNGIGSRETWAKLVGRARPVAAITGTYFDTRSGVPIGTIGVNGQTIHSSPIGTAFRYSLFDGPSIETVKPWNSCDFSGSSMYLRAGPRLLTGGTPTLYPRAEGFRDPAIFRRSARTAMAITKHGKLLLVATAKPVLLRQLAAALKSMGAVDAMCLDGGSSTGIYYRGKSFVAPKRSLTNVLVVYETIERFEGQVAKLNPNVKLPILSGRK